MPQEEQGLAGMWACQIIMRICRMIAQAFGSLGLWAEARYYRLAEQVR